MSESLIFLSESLIRTFLGKKLAIRSEWANSQPSCVLLLLYDFLPFYSILHYEICRLFRLTGKGTVFSSRSFLKQKKISVSSRFQPFPILLFSPLITAFHVLYCIPLSS